MYLSVSGQMVGSLDGNQPHIVHSMIGNNFPDDDEGNLIYNTKQFEGTITVYTDEEGGFAGFTISGLIPKEGQ